MKAVTVSIRDSEQTQHNQMLALSTLDTLFKIQQYQSVNFYVINLTA